MHFNPASATVSSPTTKPFTNMKHTLWMSPLALAAIVTAGCDQKPNVSTRIETLQAETRETTQSMKDYTYAEKAEFTAKMQGQLAAINKELDDLAIRIGKSSDSVKADATPKFRALRTQADKLARQLDGARDATESTWDDVKSGTRKAYDELTDGFQQARQWVSDKIAP
jgi:chromosome segregation ATPase